MRAAGKHRALGDRYQRGQAIAEMIIASAFLLVPLFLIMTLLMKYVDMDVAVQEAARYAAFERTVFMPSSSLRDATAATATQQQVQTGMLMRFFSGGQNAISNAQNTSTNGFSNQPLWHDQGGQGLVGSGAAQLSTYSDSSSGTPQDQVAQALLGTLNTISAGLAGFNLDYDGLMQAQVTLTPANPSGPIGYDNLAAPSTLFEHLGLVFHGQDTVLADGWSAANPANVKKQVQHMVPTSLFSAINDIAKYTNVCTGGLGNFGIVPDLCGLDLGYVPVNTPSEVPKDRLGSYTAPSGNSGSSQSQVISQLESLYEKMGYTVTEIKNADGSVTLIFKNSSGSTITQTVCASGTQSTPQSGSTMNLNGDVPTATQTAIGTLGKSPGKGISGFNVTSGPTYQCQAYDTITKQTVTGLACTPGDSGTTSDPLIDGLSTVTYSNVVVTSSTTHLQQTATYSNGQGGSTSSTTDMTLTVTADQNASGQFTGKSTGTTTTTSSGASAGGSTCT